MGGGSARVCVRMRGPDILARSLSFHSKKPDKYGNYWQFVTQHAQPRDAERTVAKIQ